MGGLSADFWQHWWSSRSTIVLQLGPCRPCHHTVEAGLGVCLLGDTFKAFYFACMPQAVLLAACL